MQQTYRMDRCRAGLLGLIFIHHLAYIGRCIQTYWPTA